MLGSFNTTSETQRLRARNSRLEKENQDLRAGLNLDKFQEECEKKAEQRNKDLERTVKRLQQDLDKCAKQTEERNGDLERNCKRLSRNLEKSQKQNEELRESLRLADQTAGELKSRNKELEAALESADKASRKMEEEIKSLNEQLSLLQKKAEEDAKVIAELENKVLSLGGTVDKLKAQAETSYTNSGKPSSKSGYHKPIANGRTQTGKQQGGQPGHPHYGRKIGLANGGEFTVIGNDDPLWDDPDYEFTGYAAKHVLTPVVSLIDQIYFVPQFRNRKTGAHKNAECPVPLQDEVIQSPETKALLLYLNFFANISLQKCKGVMSAFTNGAYSPSTGFLSKLPIEFAEKSEAERADAYLKLLGVHALHVDGTVIKIGGRHYYLTICVSGRFTLYYFRPKKGHAGVKDTIIEKFGAILIHDHAIEYYSYGEKHQECLEHIKRYLIRSIELETDKTWNVKMLQLIEKLMKEAKEIDREREKEKIESDDNEILDSENPRARFSAEMIEEYNKDFLRITETGIEEYKERPPKTWFKDGKNLCQRLHDDPNAYLLFLEDDQVDYTNNSAEQKARIVKRKLASCMEFRGFLNVIAYCESMSVIETLRATDLPVFEAMAEIFRRPSKPVNTIRIQKENLSALQTILTMDKDTKNRDEKKLDELREKLIQAKAECESCTQSYTDALSQRILNKGKESEPDEEEKALSILKDSKEHRVFNLELAVSKAVKNCEFNDKHISSTQKLIDEAESTIKKLEKKIDSDANGKTQKKKETKPLPGVEESVLEEAMKIVGEKKALFEEAQANVKKARKVYTEAVVYPKDMCTTPVREESVLQGENTSDQRREERAAAKCLLEEANQKLENALSEYTLSKKNLDAIKKGYKLPA